MRGVLSAGVVAVSAAALSLGGCASSGPTGDQVLNGGIKPEVARLVIYRPSVIGFAVQPDYLVNGHKVGTSQSKGFLLCELRPGPRQISVGNPELNVNFGSGTDKVDVDLRAGVTTYLQAQPQLGLTMGVITLQPVAESQGRSESAELHKTDSTCQAADGAKPAQASVQKNDAEPRKKRIRGF
jgi:hypothetical protein